MSFFGDTFKFENFKMSKMWDEIKHHPQRLLFGAMMDPLSTKIENGITGSHFTPQSDQLGGAFGGRTISAFGGGQQGGIYKQAKDAGVPTGQAMKFEDAAHIAAALAGAVYGGSALYGAYGGGGGSGGLTEFGTGAGQDASLTALNGGGALNAGGGAASSGAGWQQYARLASNMQGGGGQQQQGGQSGMRDWTQPATDYMPKTQEQLLAEALAKQQNSYG